MGKKEIVNNDAFDLRPTSYHNWCLLNNTLSSTYVLIKNFIGYLDSVENDLNMRRLEWNRKMLDLNLDRVK